MDNAVRRGSPMPIDPLLLPVGRGPVPDFLDVRFGLDMSAATRCRSDGSCRPCKNLSWFIVSGMSIFSKLSSDVTAASSAWYTQVKNGPKALTE